MASTPAIRALDRAGAIYTLHPYQHDPQTRGYGVEAAEALGVEPARIFKTLIARLDGRLAVGIVPVAGQLDLKALAAALGGKRAALAEVADAERATGYVHGGISPLGQRKPLPTAIDESATTYDTIHVSAGRRGLQVELAPADLVRICQATVAPIVR